MTPTPLNFEVSELVKTLIAEEKLAALIDTFRQLDANQDGRVDINEYLEFVLTQEQVRRTKRFETLDADRDGRIDFEEFVAATEPTFSILKKFQELDRDRNGLLSVAEALEIANYLYLPLSSGQIQTLMNKADRDGDGQVTYYEFLGAIAHIGFQ